MKIAIAGSGALGSGFGYQLYKNGEEVTLLDHWDEHIQAVNENGLQITVNGDKDTIEIPMMEPKDLKDTMDLIFIFTKSMGLESMLEDIKHLIDENTKVVCLLNGLGHAQTLKKYLQPENVFMGTTMWTAGLDKPGVSHLQGDGPVELQNMALDGKEAAENIVALLKEAGLNGEYSENVDYTTWRKASVNGTMNALSALLDANLTEIFEVKQIQSILKSIIEEFSLAAKLEDQVDLDVDEMVHYLTKGIGANVGSHYPSMHQDISNRRPTEIDFLNGAVVKILEEHEKEAKYCKAITDLIHAKEDVLGIER
ncbi:MAG: 2-dehydropantoate 2-reductase [Atopostipes suicloacalis]|nr:2-dehydropantoate 2-reductase [Atopostipes suicloacalis]